MNKLFIKYQAILFPFFDIALNGANYLFNVYISWYLIPNDYGVLNALISLSSLMMVTGISFQTYTAKSIAEEENKLVYHTKLSSINKSAIKFASLISVIYLLALSWLKLITRASYLSLIMVLLIFLLNIFLSINRGYIQGIKKFLHLNLSFYIEVGSKIIFVVFFLSKFQNINIVLGSIGFGMLLSFVHSFVVSRSDFKGQSVVEEFIEHHSKAIMYIFFATFFTYFFQAFDAIAINYFLPSVSGYFAVVLKYTQILQFAALSITTVFIPILAKNKRSKQKFMKNLILIYSIDIIIILGAVITYYFLATPTVDFFLELNIIRLVNIFCLIVFHIHF